MNLEQRPLTDLVPYMNNARTHSPAQVRQIAASIQEFGFNNPILIDEHGGIIAGHGRLMAAMSLGRTDAPCLVIAGLTEAQKRAYVIADNQIANNAEWDISMLRAEVRALIEQDFDTELLGFDNGYIEELIAEVSAPPENDNTGSGGADLPMVTASGDVWQLGPHRVMCGDSTSAADVATLMQGEVAEMVHADPPYGMGKQKDGVENDNLYREKLDKFQMAWWRAFRPYLDERASGYIWGNAPDLWRLWYQGGLEASEPMDLRNEIVWDKGSTPGMKSSLLTQYATASERCLFFTLGKVAGQVVNMEDYWDGWEPLRTYLEGQAKAAGVTPKRCREITGVHMYGHWFSKSQWSLISEVKYGELAAACPGFFTKPWWELRREYETLKPRCPVGPLGERAYFCNSHDIMRDVWDFPRVVGEERHKHATPKPVEMMERIMKSSLPIGSLCVEPFGGSGSTLMAAEKSDRVCYTMEMTPEYVDTIVRRWQKHTGEQAVNMRTGETFDDAEAAASE